jgi:hypothetical protein
LEEEKKEVVIIICTERIGANSSALLKVWARKVGSEHNSVVDPG